MTAPHREQRCRYAGVLEADPTVSEQSERSCQSPWSSAAPTTELKHSQKPVSTANNHMRVHTKHSTLIPCSWLGLCLSTTAA